MSLQTLMRIFSVAGLLAFSGCGSDFKNARVDIQYEERAVCSCFTEQPGSTPELDQCAGEGLFVIYKIESLNNVDTQAQPFSFDPANLLSNLSDKSETVGQPLSNFNTVPAVNVPAQAIVPLFQRVALHTSTTDPNAEHDLFYKNFLDRNVNMIRFPPPQNAPIVRQTVCSPADLPPDGPGK